MNILPEGIGQETLYLYDLVSGYNKRLAKRNHTW
jgi:hypothetical protein